MHGSVFTITAIILLPQLPKFIAQNLSEDKDDIDFHPQ
jgi:hypothetical protein